jgi:hypothetical protein
MMKESNGTLTLSSNLSATVRRQIEALPCFQGLATERLCQIAQGKLRNKRTIQCRLTAMLVIVGVTPLDDEVFQLPPTINERNANG